MRMTEGSTSLQGLERAQIFRVKLRRVLRLKRSAEEGNTVPIRVVVGRSAQTE